MGVSADAGGAFSLNSVSFSQMGRRLRRGLDKTVKLWMTSGECLQTLEGHSVLFACLFLQMGRRLHRGLLTRR